MSSAVLHVPSTPAAYTAALEGLARENEYILGSENLPSLYDSGARYAREKRDVWYNAREVAGQGWGDCEDLAAYRVADLRHTGEDPDATVFVYRSGPQTMHAIVRRGDGSYEDPSRVLGMSRKSPTMNNVGADMDDIEDAEFQEATDLAPYQDSEQLPEEAQPFNDAAPEPRPAPAPATAPRPTPQQKRKQRKKRAHRVARFARAGRRFLLGDDGAFMSVGDDPEPHLRTITFDLYKSGRGWSAVLKLPTQFSSADATFLHSSPSPSKDQASAKAANLAKLALKSPAIQAALPPQARAALTVFKHPAAKAAAKAALRKFF